MPGPSDDDLKEALLELLALQAYVEKRPGRPAAVVRHLIACPEVWGAPRRVAAQALGYTVDQLNRNLSRFRIQWEHDRKGGQMSWNCRGNSGWIGGEPQHRKSVR